MEKIKVLVVDDSAVARRALSAALNSAPDIQVVGTAADPFEAQDMIKRTRPDVLTLDVVMPGMDGIAFLKSLMAYRPMPVIMVAAHCDRSKQDTLAALELGAVDFVAKPSAGLDGDRGNFGSNLQEKIRIAARAKLLRRVDRPAAGHRAARPRDRVGAVPTSAQVVAIGASTGGTEAIREILMDMPRDCPPILIAQHIPKSFSASFAQRLNEQCQINVVEATHDEPILTGNAYLAPGDFHLTLRSVGKAYHCYLDQLPKVNRHRPSVDVLFDSVAKSVARGRGIGVLLTGMGSDGAIGLKKMRDMGFYTLAQDEASSVVWGMPGAAVKLGGADKVVSLGEVSRELLQLPPRAKVS